MIERLGIIVLAMMALTGAAQPEDDFRPTPDEQKRFELMSRPESWFLQSLAGPREVIDGQRLDPRHQYYFEERRRRTPEQVQRGLATFLDPQARIATLERLTREWALFTKVTAPMRTVEDRKIDSAWVRRSLGRRRSDGVLQLHRHERHLRAALPWLWIGALRPARALAVLSHRAVDLGCVTAVVEAVAGASRVRPASKGCGGRWPGAGGRRWPNRLSIHHERSHGNGRQDVRVETTPDEGLAKPSLSSA